MRTIKEYHIDKDKIIPQTIYATKNAEVVNVVLTDFDLDIITLCDSTETSTDLRTFKICNVGEIIYDNNIRYVGNFGTQHVIEIL